MAGLRLTVRRPVDSVFARHPLPWRRQYGTQLLCMNITDARGRVVMRSNDVHLIANWTHDMYCYCLCPEALRSITMIDGHGFPRILDWHRLPWELQEERGYDLRYNPFHNVTLRDASGHIVVAADITSAVRIPAMRILFELAQLAEDKYYKFWRCHRDWAARYV